MRKRISKEGREIIIDNPEDRHKSRNVNADVVGENKAYEKKLAKRRKKR